MDNVKSKRATISDVAKHAGVGKVTVSYVLNGHSHTARISDQTAQKVLESARALAYTPNAVARSLARRRTDVLAVVFQLGSYFATTSAFTAEVLKGVATEASHLSCDLMLHTRDVPKGEEAAVLSDGRVDGVLVLRDEGDETLRELEARGFPVVQFFSRSENASACYVDADNYAGGRMATKHLLDLGHRRISMIRGSLRSTSSNDRYNGYRDALESHGIGVAPERVLSLGPDSSDEEPFVRLFSTPDRPTALFVWSDDVAFRCLRILSDMGISVPDDVSLVGFDSLESCERSSPRLTSVRQPVSAMAQAATRLLVALTRAENPAQRQLVFPLSLDIRGSTSPLFLGGSR